MYKFKAFADLECLCFYLLEGLSDVCKKISLRLCKEKLCHY